MRVGLDDRLGDPAQGTEIVQWTLLRAQAALAALAPVCAGIADQALTAGPDDLGGCAFLADIASMKHETQYSRLFRS